MPITHATVATDPEEPLLDADDWNAAHTVSDGSFSIAATSGLQDALDAKQPLATVLTNTTASFTTAQESKLAGIAAGAEVNVNADWDATSGDAQILNKPTIPDLSTAVLKSDYTPAHSILVQQSGTGSPEALQIGNNTLVGRLSGGGSAINDLSATDVRTLLSIGNVDNTSDADKPISDATQTALDAVVPYTGATADVDLGTQSIKTTRQGINTDIPTDAMQAIKVEQSGAVYSDELIADSDDQYFNSDTGNWTGTGWDYTGYSFEKTDITADRTLTLNLADALSEPLEVGATYYVLLGLENYTSGKTVSVALGVAGGYKSIGQMSLGYASEYTLLFTPSSTSNNLTLLANQYWTGQITLASIRKVIAENQPFSLMLDSNEEEVNAIRAGLSYMGMSFIGGNSGRFVTEYINYGTLSNFAVGGNALQNLVEGYSNFAAGSFALNALGYGADNFAAGALALVDFVSGDYNLALGSSAASQFREGIGNTFIGALAGGNCIAGNNNLAIGVSSTLGNTSDALVLGPNCALPIGSGANGQVSLKNGIYGTGHTADATTISSGNWGFFVKVPASRVHFGGKTIVSDDTSLGSNLVTNGTFTGNATGWTLGTGWTYASNQIRKSTTGTGTLSQSLAITAGKLYRISVSVVSVTLGGFTISLGGATSPSIANTGTIVVHVVASSTAALTFTPDDTNSLFVLDTITVQEVTGGVLNVVESLGIGTVGTPTARLELPASSTAKASMRINSGVAPTSPNDGDIWNDGTNIMTRINGVTRRLSSGVYVLASSAVPASLTGTTAQTILQTVSIPANVMGANGAIRVTSAWSYTNSADNKLLRVRFGGISGAAYAATTVTTTASVQSQLMIQNRNNTASQVGSNSNMGGFQTGSVATVTSTEDTTSAVDLVFTGQHANSANTITLERYLVELIIP